MKHGLILTAVLLVAAAAVLFLNRHLNKASL